MTDDDTGLLLLEHRYYVPRLGRFLTQDPKGQAGGLNLYEYCGDNPIDRSDPSGLDEIFVSNPPITKSLQGGHKSTQVPGFALKMDVPDGQNIDKNIKTAEAVSAGGFVADSIWLRSHVAGGTVGDYGKNLLLYPHSGDSKELATQRRLAGNFNFGAVVAAMGLDRALLLNAGDADAMVKGYIHPESEQTAISDGYWYYYSSHPAKAKAKNVEVPKGITFNHIVQPSSP